MILSSFLYLLSFFIVNIYGSFQTNPIKSVQALSGIIGTTIMISNDQTLIGAGFDDGTFKLFDIELNQKCSNKSVSGQPIIGSMWMPTFGPVTVGISNKVIIWSTQCKIKNQASFSAPIQGINYFQSIDNSTGEAKGNNTGLIALNFGTYIQQYNVENFTLLTKYVSKNNDTFLDFLYYNNGTRNMLIASTQGSKIRVMSMQTGNQTQSFKMQSPIQMMIDFEKTEQRIILGYAQNKYIYRFTSGGQPYQLKQFPSSDGMTFCPSTKQFAISFSQTKQIGVYLYSGDNQKMLANLQGQPQQIDCSDKYLVAIDDKGYINLYTYEELNNYIIGIIIGIAAGLFLIIVGVAVFIFLKRKRANQLQQKNNLSKNPKKFNKVKNQQQSQVDNGYLLQNITPIKLKTFVQNQSHL